VTRDVRGTANGTYVGGPRLGAWGWDTDPSARFDGVDDEMSAARDGDRHDRGLVLLGGRCRTDARLELVGRLDPRLRPSGGQVAYRVAGTTFTTPLATGGVRDGWHHVALTVEGGKLLLSGGSSTAPSAEHDRSYTRRRNLRKD
jgi:hypothetical protein